MKSDYLNDARNKNDVEGRQYLQRRRLTKPVHYKNGDFDSDLALAMQESLQMARQKENELKDIENRVLTNGAILDEIPATKMAGKINNRGVIGNHELTEMKDLLLLHVELIQHQGDLLERKDKEIKELKSEKQALECRLERMERRMSLLKQKEESHDTDDVEEIQESMIQSSPDKGIKRKSTCQLNSVLPGNSSARKTPKTYHLVKTKTEKCVNKTEETVIKNTPKSKHKPSIIFNEGEDTVLKTENIYHVLESELRSRHVEIFRNSEILSNVQSQKENLNLFPVEVPSWRIIKYTNLYQMEGTENLEDEMIIKRHQKPELEEKRRKRWDIQRMREQRAAKKLREKENSTSTDQQLQMSQDVDSFLPILDDITHIEILDNLPVIAFGQPLPSITSQEFQLPWECDKSSINKRHSASRPRRK